MSERNAEDIAIEMDEISRELDNINYTCVPDREIKSRFLIAKRDKLNVDHKAALDRQTFCTIPVYGWVCFHCGIRCYTQAEATEHFGKLPTAKPQCSAAETAEHRTLFKAAILRAVLEVDGPVRLRPEIAAELAKQGWDRLDTLIQEMFATDNVEKHIGLGAPAHPPGMSEGELMRQGWSYPQTKLLERDAQGFTATDRAIIADDPT